MSELENRHDQDLETAAKSAPKGKIFLRVAAVVGLGVLCFCLAFIVVYHDATFRTIDILKERPFIAVLFLIGYPPGASALFFLLGTWCLWPVTVALWTLFLFLLVTEGSAWFLLIPLLCCFLGLWCFKRVKSLRKFYFRAGGLTALFSFVMIGFFVGNSSAVSSDHFTFVPYLRDLKAAASLYAADHGGDLSGLSEDENHILSLKK